jgi:hypothetical protein
MHETGCLEMQAYARNRDVQVYSDIKISKHWLQWLRQKPRAEDGAQIGVQLRLAAWQCNPSSSRMPPSQSYRLQTMQYGQQACWSDKIAACDMQWLFPVLFSECVERNRKP